MRILAVNWRDLRNPDAGGAEVHLHKILSGMAEKGHEVTLVASNFRGGKEVEEYDGVRVIRKGRWFDANYAIPLFLRSYLKENHYDLIIEDINKIPFFLPATTGRKVVAVVPHLFGLSVYRETNPLFASYVYIWEKFIPFVYQSCNFIAISPSTKEDLVNRGIPHTQIEVVLCGLDKSTYRVLEGVERYEKPTLVHFGRIRRYKSIDVVMRAFAIVRREMNGARLLIIGDGPERPNLERLAGKLALGDSVEFLGTVPTGRLVEILNKAHLFMNASVKEGWGLTVVEANACGLPVIASDRPGLKDSVKNESTGFLVEYGNVRGFAEKALLLLKDRDLWEGMSRAAIEHAGMLSWERTVEEMERIFLRELG